MSSYLWKKLFGSKEKESCKGRVMEAVRVSLGSGEGLFIHTIQLNSHPRIKELLPSYILKYSDHEYVMDIFLCLWVYLRREWQPTPVFLPGESHGQEPGTLQSIGSQKAGYNWSNLACTHAWIHFSRMFSHRFFFLTINANLTFYYIFVDFEVQILMSEKK